MEMGGSNFTDIQSTKLLPFEDRWWAHLLYMITKDWICLRWHGRPSAEVNENINLGYSQDQGYS